MSSQPLPLPASDSATQAVKPLPVETFHHMSTLGRSDQSRRLLVAFTVRRKLIRVISARDMTPRERKIYEAYEDAKTESPSDV